MAQSAAMNALALTIADNWHFTKVYALSGGRWQVIAWHASPAPP